MKGDESMAEGPVKRWLDLRGYGFISTDEYEKDVFVHHSAIRDRSFLKDGEKVRFDIEETDRGPRAANVEVVS